MYTAILRANTEIRIIDMLRRKTAIINNIQLLPESGIQKWKKQRKLIENYNKY